MEKGEIIASLFGLLGGSIGTALIPPLFLRKKTRAEAEEINTQVTISINKAALEQIESFRTDVAALREENKRLHEELEIFREENRQLREEINLLRTEIGKYQRKNKQL